MFFFAVSAPLRDSSSAAPLRRFPQRRKARKDQSSTDLTAREDMEAKP